MGRDPRNIVILFTYIKRMIVRSTENRYHVHNRASCMTINIRYVRARGAYTIETIEHTTSALRTVKKIYICIVYVYTVIKGKSSWAGFRREKNEIECNDTLFI